MQQIAQPQTHATNLKMQLNRAMTDSSDLELDRLTSIETPDATLQAHSYGAHISRWDSVKFGQVLFETSAPEFGTEKSIHAGIPLCFPWFGPFPERDEDHAPQLGAELSHDNHGFARSTKWRLQDFGDGVIQYALNEADLATGDNKIAPFNAVYTAQLNEESLKLSLQVTNTGPEVFRFEEALHTYFLVHDVRQAEICGLEEAPYLDKNNPTDFLVGDFAPLHIDGPIDRVYKSAANVTIVDAGLGRVIQVEKSGSATTVIWNPGAKAAAKLYDLKNDDWQHFICLETANALDDIVVLHPGQSHEMTAEYKLQSL